MADVGVQAADVAASEGEAEHPRGARRRLPPRTDDREERRLAAAVRPEQNHRSPGRIESDTGPSTVPSILATTSRSSMSEVGPGIVGSGDSVGPGAVALGAVGRAGAQLLGQLT